jgi:predicted choloylglycine hydrolase
MKFSDIFWTTLRVRTAIKIQDTIIDSVTEAGKRAIIASNMPIIIRELLECENHFGSFLEKQRKLIQVDKALSNLHKMNELTDKQKQIAREELLKLKQFLEI